MEPTLGPLPSDQELLSQRGFLRRLARGLLGDDGLAEDAVQEAELRALQRGPQKAGALRAWLATVTRRLALNERRARDRQVEHERVAARSELVPSQDEALDGLELQGAVLDAVRALDEPYRTAVWLRYYEDRSPGEIAARLGLPLATVKTRLRRALERLRADLDRKREGRREAWALALAELVRPSTVVTLGGGLLMKKLVAALALALLAFVGWRVVRGEPEPARVVLPVLAANAELAAQTSSVEPLVPANATAVRASLESGPVAPAVSATPAAATLAVHATWQVDGSDAEGIGLVLWPADDAVAELAARIVGTDAGGRAFFDAVPPGRYTVHTDRDGESPLELRAGEERELALTVPAGLDVAGIVLDGSGAPVGGAEVWLEGQGTGSLAGRIVARAAADGSFHLRALESEQRLGALAPGFAPSSLELLREKVRAPGSSEARVKLVLEREGRELHGIVLDPEGRPVSGAHVALGSRGNIVNSRGWRPRARVFLTGDDGEFRAWVGTAGPRGMPLVLVHVLAPGLALARLEEQELGTPVHEVRVRLEDGATIEGQIRTADGRAVAGALVALRSAGTIEAGSSPFGLPSARTGADGAYRLEHMPSGEVHLVVSLESDPRSGAEEARRLADGAHERWDLTLGAARVITGRVVDDQGTGLANQAVLVSDGRSNAVVTTDGSGAFVFFPSSPSEKWSLTLMTSGGASDSREDVAVGSEVVLVAWAHRAAIHGGFTDRAGLVRESEAVVASLRPAGEVRMTLQAEIDAQGAFAFDGVKPGTYRVRIQSGERTLAESPEFTVAEDHVLELEWLESQAEPH